VSIALLMNTEAKIIRRSASGEDAYGNETSEAVDVDVLCEVQKQVRHNEEPGDQGEMSDTRWVGYFPAEAELDTADAVRVPGVGVLELVGAPWKVRNPRTKTVHHLEVPLRQTASAEEGS
jgi:hypothetical protein